MRVIAGIARRRRLKSVRSQQVRPTSDRVKESLFSILGNRVVAARVLDLFAGTGNLGIEALSRGAKFAVFVDNDARSIKVIKENIVSLGFDSSAEVIAGELPRVLKAVGSNGFDMVFFDPPYLQDLEVTTINALVEYQLLNANAIVVVEHHKKTELPKEIRYLKKVRQQKYGDTVVTFYKNQPNCHCER
ncbi:MAG: 16S rRNA (guanine(966)-N(2))-methyltransferase RsmD [bacterium]|nr:16S rRNA (guanine(966)-N(2))-methyltransferase RsmD [bacterium]